MGKDIRILMIPHQNRNKVIDEAVQIPPLAIVRVAAQVERDEFRDGRRSFELRFEKQLLCRVACYEVDGIAACYFSRSGGDDGDDCEKEESTDDIVCFHGGSDSVSVRVMIWSWT